MLRMVILDVEDWDRIQKQLAMTMANIHTLQQMLEGVQHVAVTNLKERDEGPTMAMPSEMRPGIDRY